MRNSEIALSASSVLIRSYPRPNSFFVTREHAPSCAKKKARLRGPNREALAPVRGADRNSIAAANADLARTVMRNHVGVAFVRPRRVEFDFDATVADDLFEIRRHRSTGAPAAVALPVVRP